MLSAIAHPDSHGVLDALFATFTPDIDPSPLYADLVRTVLPEAARKYLEDLMTTTTWEYQSDFARKYFGAGKAEGLAEGVLAVLDARGISVPDDVRARISNCADAHRLDGWLIRAANATTLGDVFD